MSTPARSLLAASLLSASLILPSISLPAAARAPQATLQPADAKPVLEASAKAIAELRAFSYSFTSTETGGDGKAARYEGLACAAKADAGGWKVYASGKIIADSESNFEIAYDGVAARSIKPADKVVVERNLETVDELAVFFSGQNARHPIAWEILADKPFSAVEKAILEGSQTIDGVECDKVLIPSTPDPAAAIADTGTRLFIAKSDHLPRRIERLRAVKSETATTEIARVIEITDLKRDTDAQLHAFSLNAPDGFRIRADTSGNANRLVRGNRPANSEERKPQDSGLLATGSDAPAWTLKDGSGAEVSLASLKGKVVVMDFWATWCGPCKAAMPHVQKLHDKYASKDVAVYGVNTWERADAKKYMSDKKFTYGLLLKGDKVAEQYKVKGIPTFYVIDKEGKIAFSAVGMPDESRLEAIIDEALAK
jgi:thiol-disulfide isomerase/thioredoxin